MLDYQPHRTRNRKLEISTAKLQKPSRGNQLIHRRLSKTKSIGCWSDPQSRAGRQSDGYGGWRLELRRGGRYREKSQVNQDRISCYHLRTLYGSGVSLRLTTIPFPSQIIKT